MKMATSRKKPSHGQIDEVDRISDLPEVILHDILSYMGTKEACRAGTLSKRWASVWATIPFLNFQFKDFFKKNFLTFTEQDLPEKDVVDRYVNFIDGTMQRYSQQKLCIKKLRLELPMLDHKLTCLVDKWLEIAVLNHLEQLNVSIMRNSPSYILPDILFSAKSLRVLRCHRVELPYYQVMKLTSLKILDLDEVDADESMLQHIISSCPLTHLDLTTCAGLANISIPYSSKIECLRLRDVADGNINFNQETGSLKSITYHGELWQCKISAGALRNLKKLKIYCAHIDDDIFVELLNELTLVDTLSLYECYTLQNLNISSDQLKELTLQNCLDLENVVVNAPNLAFFCYNGDQEISLSFVNVHPQCDAYFNIETDYIDYSWLARLKMFLIRSNVCNLLNILLPKTVCKSKSNFDMLRKITGGPAYELKELKLSPACNWKPTDSSLSAFLDGLFWICRPASLSITSCLDYDNTFIKLLVEILKTKVKCWQHPLRGVQVESIDCPSLTKYESSDMDLDVNIRLCW